VNLTKTIQGDGGIDMLLFYRDMLVIIQCKDLKSKVKIGMLKEFKTTFEGNECNKKLGIFISSNGFSNPCHEYKKKFSDLLLLDNLDDIENCIKTSYELLIKHNNLLNDARKNVINYNSSINIDMYYLYLFFVTLLLFILVIIYL
jgi:Restriction endonuclease